MDLECRLLRGSSVLRLRRRVATATIWGNTKEDHMIEVAMTSKRKVFHNILNDEITHFVYVK